MSRTRARCYDPALIRRDGQAIPIVIKSFVIFVTSRALYISHVFEFGAAVNEELHQTSKSSWLRNTRAPRAKPVVGIVAELGEA